MLSSPPHLSLFFFFNDTATTEIYTLSLHDALPICDHDLARRGCVRGRHVAEPDADVEHRRQGARRDLAAAFDRHAVTRDRRSEEHTSELQSRLHLVCRLLLEKKKSNTTARPTPSAA